MILGVRFSPEGLLPWFDEVGGTRRRLSPGSNSVKSDEGNDSLPVIGRAVTGHLIHGLEVIAFHRTGLGINLIITDSEGVPIE